MGRLIPSPEPPAPLSRHRLAGNTLRGLKRGVRGYSRFSVLIFFAAVVAATAAVLRCELLEWGLLLGGIGLVLTAELFHGAVETVVRGLEESARQRVAPALDLAAAAGVVASVSAGAVGVVVFLHRLGLVFFPGGL
jgi:diacylglycerol kinase (ATP)